MVALVADLGLWQDEHHGGSPGLCHVPWIAMLLAWRLDSPEVQPPASLGCLLAPARPRASLSPCGVLLGVCVEPLGPPRLTKVMRWYKRMRHA